jgi:tRNA-uridine 2-sulfurtransferase
MNKKIHVIVGMSGGVDSSLAALLLKQQGYHVEGLFMKNWEEEEKNSNCAAAQDLIDAQTICLKLGIHLHTINFSTEYWDRVFTYFLDEYQKGRTPNPDVICNKEIKFKAFLDHALSLGADYIATGHYARCQHPNMPPQPYQLLKGLDPLKDQSYFLYLLNQQQLSKSLFPIGELKKVDVRKMAEQQEFRNYNKKGSTGICFIGERKFKQFLSLYLPAHPGNIETIDGQHIGKHEGLMYYTIGQRQGIGIGGLKNQQEMPWYVLKKELARNVLIVGQGENHPALFSNSLKASQLHWVSGQSPFPLPFHCAAKTRYRQPDQSCIIADIENDKATITFTNPQRAITPGQSIVFYQNDVCLGGGIIN